ncbi:hypothetical protein ABBQ38_009736 [Trebouxia sp. C0009 RCD-2024]
MANFAAMTCHRSKSEGHRAAYHTTTALQIALSNSVSSAAAQLLCEMSFQPYSVSKLVLQPGIQLEVLLLVLFLILNICGIR